MGLSESPPGNGIQKHAPSKISLSDCHANNRGTPMVITCYNQEFNPK